MADPRRVRALLDRLANEIDQLRTLGRAGAEGLITDRIRLDAAKYVMVIAVEICIDIGQHIIASEGLRAPEDFADVFNSLAEGGIIPREMVSSLKEMARFQNLLVHIYERVDDRRVVEILQSRLGDFEAFREANRCRRDVLGHARNPRTTLGAIENLYGPCV
jgi:uncharacterized protein YutE (UPF0331/DUF86 family)